MINSSNFSQPFLEFIDMQLHKGIVGEYGLHTLVTDANTRSFEV